jgi:hypothetical protein
MTISVVGLILAACFSAEPESAPPSFDVIATKDGIEIYVDTMKFVARRFKLDQAKQILVVEGTPAVCQLSSAGGSKKVFTGARITVDLAKGSFSLEDLPNRVPKEK